jgi:FAD:protein FMN transferase
VKIKKNITILIIIIGIVLSVTGCSNKEPISRETYMMGTIIQFKVYGKNGEKAVDEAITKINEIENKMSVNISASEINKINMNAGIAETKVSEETFSVVEKAVEYSKLTEGAFDATIEPIVKLWGIGTERARVPMQQEISQALELINYKDISFDNNNLSIKLNKKNQAIDLGGIAKGYAADEINKIFTQNHIENAFVSLGGNVFVKGNKINDKKWNIGIQDPFKERNEYIGIVSVSNKSVVTSGNYERYFIKDGIRYHHIFDPSTGYPSENGVVSVTIISDQSIDGDALSTSMYILGAEKGTNLIEKLEGIDAIFVTKDKKIYVTSGISQDFKLTNKEYVYEEGR